MWWTRYLQYCQISEISRISNRSYYTAWSHYIWRSIPFDRKNNICSGSIANVRYSYTYIFGKFEIKRPDAFAEIPFQFRSRNEIFIEKWKMLKTMPILKIKISFANLCVYVYHSILISVPEIFCHEKIFVGRWLRTIPSCKMPLQIHEGGRIVRREDAISSFS